MSHRFSIETFHKGSKGQLPKRGEGKTYIKLLCTITVSEKCSQLIGWFDSIITDSW